MDRTLIAHAITTNAVGFLNEDAATANATCNWWGDVSGPTNATLNPPGTGDSVSSGVTFAPWSTVAGPDFNCDGCVNVSITTQPLSTSVCIGSGTTLSVVASGTGLSYQWYQGTAPDTSTPLGTASTQATLDTIRAELVTFLLTGARDATASGEVIAPVSASTPSRG